MNGEFSMQDLVNKILLPRFDSIDARLGNLENGQGRLSGRVDGLRSGVNDLWLRIEQLSRKVENISGQVVNLSDRVDERFEQIDEKFEQMDKRFEAIDRRFDAMDDRLLKMDSRIDRLETLVKATGEQAVGMFQSLSRRFDDFEVHANQRFDELKDVCTGAFHEHKAILDDHERRITRFQHGAQP